MSRSRPFVVRYRISDHEYHAHVEQPKIDRHLRAGDASVAYRSIDVIIFYRRAYSLRPLAFVYPADDRHRRAMERFLDHDGVLVHDLGNA